MADKQFLDLDAVTKHQQAARQMVSDLCHRRREWIMSIPARPDYDPDLVIGDALTDLLLAIDEIKQMRAKLAQPRYTFQEGQITPIREGDVDEATWRQMKAAPSVACHNCGSINVYPDTRQVWQVCEDCGHTTQVVPS